MCNISLYLAPTLVFDHGSPFLLMGYSDTLGTSAAWPMLVLWLHDWLTVPRTGVFSPDAAGGARFGLVDHRSTGEHCRRGPGGNSGAGGPARLVAAPLGRSLATALVLIVATGIGSLCGGVLMPPSLFEQTDLPFVYSAFGGGGIVIDPHLEFQVCAAGRPTALGPRNARNRWPIARGNSSLWRLRSFSAHGLPNRNARLDGHPFGVLSPRRHRGAGHTSTAGPRCRASAGTAFLEPQAAIVFAYSVGGAFLFQVNGHKWDFGRFVGWPA